ncbi:MAG: hypothetical protein KIT14_08185 [bacterium]|nr:hypothetical protein [bacterium]
MHDDRPPSDASPPPIACLLDPAALAARRADLAALAARALRRIERADGVVHLHFVREAAGAVTAAVTLERQCCPFLDFAVAQPDGGDLVVSVRAPAAATAVLDDFVALPTLGEAG